MIKRRAAVSGRLVGLLFFLAALCALYGVVRYGGVEWMTSVDPGDPQTPGLYQADNMRRRLEHAYGMLEERRRNGEIDETQKTELLKEYATKLADKIDFKNMPQTKAWMYGEVLRTAEKWELAEKAFALAAKSAKDEDRRVNDHLRWAQSLAKLGRVPEALEVAEKVFNTPDVGRAPILLGVLLEIVPAAESKGHDGKLAALLERAIEAHLSFPADVSTVPGIAFTQAKSYHIQNAWLKVEELYQKAGQKDQALKARQEGQEAKRNFARI